jgi:hypothetical protein
MSDTNAPALDLITDVETLMTQVATLQSQVAALSGQPVTATPPVGTSPLTQEINGVTASLILARAHEIYLECFASNTGISATVDPLAPVPGVVLPTVSGS